MPRCGRRPPRFFRQRTMPKRIQKQAVKQETVEAEAVEPAPVEKADLQATDELLDEIDALLEENAEEFVKAYVQQGGE